MNRGGSNVLRALGALLPPGAIVLLEKKGERTWVVRIAAPAAAYVVKLYQTGSTGFEREIQALQHLSHIGSSFPVPTIIHHGALLERNIAFVIMTEIDGNTLDEMVVERRCERKAALFDLGCLMTILHKSAHHLQFKDSRSNPLTSIFERCEAQMRILSMDGEHTVAALAQNTLHWLQQRVTILDRTVFCHGDLHLRNIIVRKETDRQRVTSGVVDLESSAMMSPEFDVAKSIVASTRILNDGTEYEILKGYQFCELRDEALRGFKAFHAIDGWVYARLLRRRDRKWWDTRLRSFATGLA